MIVELYLHQKSVWYSLPVDYILHLYHMVIYLLTASDTYIFIVMVWTILESMVLLICLCLFLWEL